MNRTQQRLLDDIHFSVDCEFSGPIPGPNYMMSLGSVAFNLRKGILDQFTINFKPLPGAVMDRKTQRFWNAYPDAYQATLWDQHDPQEGMELYNEHIMGVMTQHAEKSHDPVFIEYPGGADFLWVFWYFHNFLHQCPFSHSSFSMKSYATAALNLPFRRATKSHFPRRWFNPNLLHTHVALDDAIGQADLAIRMMCDHLGIETPPLPSARKGP